MDNAANALRTHWREYLCEGAGLGFFMMSACSFGVLLGHPRSAVVAAIPDEFARRALMGLAMAATALAIIYSPAGKRSGAHLNPAVTLTYFTLGKAGGWDAAFYALFQFAGGIAGVMLSFWALGPLVSDAPVNFVATLPGPWGLGPAFAAEVLISGVLMLTVLVVSNHPALARYTPLFAGFLVASYITFEAPVSGMSMNPARTFASAFWAETWGSLWLYFTAPPLGMLMASRVYRALPGVRGVFCAKLHHFNNHPCLFRCEFHDLERLS